MKVQVIFQLPSGARWLFGFKLHFQITLFLWQAQSTWCTTGGWWFAFWSSVCMECGEALRQGCAAYSPTLSTPNLWPATWCVRGTHPFRWAWPCGATDLWRHFSIAGGPPEIRGARLTPRSAGLGFTSRRPRDSINTWRWVADICRIYKGAKGR